MKKACIFFYLSLSIMLLMLISCNNNSRQPKGFAELDNTSFIVWKEALQASELLPYKVRDGYIIKNVIYEDSIFKTVVEVDEKVYENLINNHDLWKENHIMGIATSNGDKRNSYEERVKYRIYDVFEFVRYKSKSIYDVHHLVITPDEMEMALLYDVPIIEHVKSRVKLENTSLPFELMDGLTLKRIILTNESIVFEVIVDESKINIDYMKKNKNELKIDLMKSGIIEMYELVLKDAVYSSMGFALEFEGSQTAKSLCINYSLDEMKSLLLK